MTSCFLRTRRCGTTYRRWPSVLASPWSRLPCHKPLEVQLGVVASSLHSCKVSFFCLVEPCPGKVRHLVAQGNGRGVGSLATDMWTGRARTSALLSMGIIHARVGVCRSILCCNPCMTARDANPPCIILLIPALSCLTLRLLSADKDTYAQRSGHHPLGWRPQGFHADESGMHRSHLSCDAQ